MRGMEFFTPETLTRLGCFAGVLALVGLLEALFPRRQRTESRPRRWASNLGLVAINATTLRVLFPLGAVGVALVADKEGWGLFNQAHMPGWLAVVLSIVALDLAIYLQHVMFHAVPVLWRMHMVHHADLDIDVTTGLRFHTFEIVLSLGIKLTAVVLLGAPALAVLVFEVLLNATSMFSHGNLQLPDWLDRALRLFLVTPDMHRVHHSVLAAETNSNFGFNLPWWDFLFGTYRDQPAAGHDKMTIGLQQIRDNRAVRLGGMLALPFTGEVGGYPINASGGEGASAPLARIH